VNHRARGASWRSILACGLCAFAGAGMLGVWGGTNIQLGYDSNQTASTLGRASPPHVRHSERASRVSVPFQAPAALDIPSIGVSTPLVRLGLQPDRTVEVPADADRAGWFRRGPAPGRRGSSVILGHVDSVAGPAVFARLGELRRGDSVTVTRADGSELRFVVRALVTYARSDFPARRVYAAQGERRLNLVTCSGAYDSANGGYQANLVVYTRLPHGE
jgi:sortase (surface protein transpeptidase)